MAVSVEPRKHRQLGGTVEAVQQITGLSPVLLKWWLHTGVAQAPLKRSFQE